jgi:uncharacterized membrane protein YeaQ/YmgE (transglycosylase-associated protein family)
MTEHSPQFEKEKNNFEFDQSPEKAKEKAETNVEKHEAKLPELDKIRENINKQEEETKRPVVEVTNDQHDTPPPPPNAELKAITLNRTLNKVRSQLKPTQRSFSKIIHQPVIEKASDITGSTIVRPSGFVFGSFVGLVGTSIMLYLSRHYGFKYNVFSFVIFFVAGFIVGLLLEFLYKLVRPHKKAQH